MVAKPPQGGRVMLMVGVPGKPSTGPSFVRQTAQKRLDPGPLGKIPLLGGWLKRKTKVAYLVDTLRVHGGEQAIEGMCLQMVAFDEAGPAWEQMEVVPVLDVFSKMDSVLGLHGTQAGPAQLWLAWEDGSGAPASAEEQ